jgi:hypothetical protein
MDIPLTNQQNLEKEGFIGSVILILRIALHSRSATSGQCAEPLGGQLRERGRGVW